MSVEQLASLHRRYVELSDRFRAAWAFHQFLGSLNKATPDAEPPRYPVDFQQVYTELKDISHHLNAASLTRVAERLGLVDRELARLTTVLLAEDSRIDPATLRNFFLRVRNTTVKVLSQLVKFYLYSQDPAAWPEERLDKVDFLITRIVITEEGEGPGGMSGHQDTTRELLRGLYQTLGSPPLADQWLEDQAARLDGFRQELASVRSLDDLVSRQVVPRYRRFKHELGVRLLAPPLIVDIVQVNLRLRDRIQSLYRQEEADLTSELKQVFELGRMRGVDAELEGELVSFRQEIERFEDRLERQELSLEDLSQIRRRMRSLMPRLEPVAAPSWQSTLSPTPPAEPARPVSSASAVVGAHVARIMRALEGSNPKEDARLAVLRPEVFAFRLEPRELVAFRRLTGREGAGENESFLLEAAALRVRLNEEVNEIRGILDDTITTGTNPIFNRAEESLRLADLFVRRFDHYLERAVSAGDLMEAQELQLLRMRLLRDYSGLWLLAHRPLTERVAAPAS